MSKKFNITGTCIPEKHFMVNIQNKLNQVLKMINEGNYFVINRPRQFGKTTMMYMIERQLKGEYIVLSISFEGMGQERFDNEKIFIEGFLRQIKRSLIFLNEPELERMIETPSKINTLDELDDFITKFLLKIHQKVILLIDEVDKSSNNQLFLDFLGMLRNKFLRRNEGKDYTFHSVILAGVHDVKNLKLKIRPDSERKYNSPWNIATDFKVDMSFNPREISTMLEDYLNDRNIIMDIEEVSNKLYFYSHGYPYFVSKLCKIIDEELFPDSKEWTEAHVDEAFKAIVKENNVNFDDMIKNLENNNDLYELVKKLTLEAEEFVFNRHDPIIEKGVIYGILREDSGKVKIFNRIYEQVIYDYMASKVATTGVADMNGYNYKGNFVLHDGILDMKKVLIKFQEFIKEQHCQKDEKFMEREGRLLLLAFIKPIINGYGFDFKEVQISEEKRLDIVITYLKEKYVIELKVWRGQQAHERGLQQLKDYLDRAGLKYGYLVIYDFRKEKDYRQEIVNVGEKQIFCVVV